MINVVQGGRPEGRLAASASDAPTRARDAERGGRQIEVSSEKLRMAEDGLNRLAEVVGGLMKMASTGELSEEIENDAAMTATTYCRIGAAACHILADTIETLERSERE